GRTAAVVPERRRRQPQELVVVDRGRHQLPAGGCAERCGRHQSRPPAPGMYAADRVLLVITESHLITPLKVDVGALTLSMQALMLTLAVACRVTSAAATTVTALCSRVTEFPLE